MPRQTMRDAAGIDRNRLMVRLKHSSWLILPLLGAVLFAAPALAQWGSIFGGDQPPRPPATVPGGRQPVEPAVPQDRLPPGPPPGRVGPPPGSGIQSQPLPPPPGNQLPPQQARPAPPAAPQVPAQRPMAPGQQQPPAPQQASVPPVPDEVIVHPPAQKIVNPTAVFSGLDKITGRIITFDVAIDETVRFGALEVTPRVCYTRPPTEAPATDGFVEVDELTLQGELRRIFTGWMFVASPGLNAVEHPIYDVWLSDCKGGSQPAVAEVKSEAAPVPPPRPQRQQQQQQRRTVTPQPPQQQQQQQQQQFQRLPPPPFR